MKLAPVHYLRPRTEPELLNALAEFGSDAAVLAGGQSLIPELALRTRSARVLVDINHLDGAQRIDGPGDTEGTPRGVLRIGARVRHRDVLARERMCHWSPVLAMAAAHVGNAAIRNRGTVCGSLAHADPAGEFPLAAVALNAQVVLRSSQGERSVDADAFFTGSFMTSRRADEYLASLQVPCAADDSFHFFDEIALRPTASAVASIAMVVEGLKGEGSSALSGAMTVRIAIGGVCDRPRLLAATSVALSRRLHDTDAARAILRAELAPLLTPATQDDSNYRLHLATTLLLRARAALCQRLSTGSA